MTDGPFKNRNLSAPWKRYGVLSVNDATSPNERAAQACHAMLSDVNMKQVIALMGDLNTYQHRSELQGDLLPDFSVGAIFADHPNSVFTNTFQKHLIANVRDQIPFATARSLALVSTVTDLSLIAKNRLDEQSLLARKRREITQAVHNKFLQSNQNTFDTLNHKAVCDALLSGNKNAFKAAIQKQIDVDAGPTG